MIRDFDNQKILNDKALNNLFLSATLKDTKEQCKFLKGDFYLDSFNYFPITTNYETFYNLFKRQDENRIEHFYSENFYNNLKEKEKNFKIFEKSFVLGSSPADNYYSNLIYFLPRIFFVGSWSFDIHF